MTLSFHGRDKVARREGTRNHGSEFQAPSAADGTLRDEALPPFLSLPSGCAVTRAGQSRSVGALWFRSTDLSLCLCPVFLSLPLSRLLSFCCLVLLCFGRFTHIHTQGRGGAEKETAADAGIQTVEDGRQHSSAAGIVCGGTCATATTTAGAGDACFLIVAAARHHLGYTRAHAHVRVRTRCTELSSRQSRMSRAARCARARGLTSARYRQGRSYLGEK